MTNSSSHRVFGYDVAKCLAMFLVVELHYTFYVPLYSNTVFNNVFAVLTCIGVPLFFTVNGALLFSKPLDIKKHYSKTAKIIAVVLVWKLISAVLMGLMTGRNPLEGGREFLVYLLFGNLEGFNLGHFWFMYALIALYLVFPVFKICFDAGGKTALGVMLACILVFTAGVSGFNELSDMAAYSLGLPSFSFEGVKQLYLFGEYGYTLLFFIGGGLVANSKFGVHGTISKKALVIAGIAFVASWALLFGVQRFQVATEKVAFIVLEGYWNIFTITMTASAFILLSHMKTNSKVLFAAARSIGNNTLGIYFLHMFVLTGLASLITPYVSALPFAGNLALMAGAYLLSFAAAYLGSKIPGIRLLFKL